FPLPYYNTVGDTRHHTPWTDILKLAYSTSKRVHKPYDTFSESSRRESRHFRRRCCLLPQSIGLRRSVQGGGVISCVTYGHADFTSPPHGSCSCRPLCPGNPG
ncbi:unnamed protein product, partial [Ectocarpus sp. 8 AP-2014]